MKRKAAAWAIHLGSIILITAMSVSVLSFVLPNERYISFEYLDKSKQSFEETETFSRIYEGCLRDALHYTFLANRLEQNGALDTSRFALVTISEAGVISEYTIKDLYTSLWSLPQEQVLWCLLLPDYPQSFEAAVELNAYYHEKERSAIGETAKTEIFLQENQTLISTESAASLNNIWEQIDYELEFYRNFKEAYITAPSNFTFAVTLDGLPLMDNGYTGTSGYLFDIAVTDIDEKVTADLPCYSRTKNIPYAARDYFHLDDQVLTLKASVDTSYSHQDDFARCYAAFSSFRKQLPPMIGCLLFGGITFIVSFIFLILYTGRKKDTNEISLSFLDRIYLEPFILLWSAGFLLLFAVILYLIDYIDHYYLYSADRINTYVSLWSTLLAAGFTVLWLVFLLPFLSLVRRIKAHVFWKHSILGKLLGKICSFWHLAYTNKEEGKKLLFCSGIFVVSFLILFFFAFVIGQWSSFLLLLELACLALCAFLYFYLAKRLLAQAKSRKQLVEATDGLAKGDFPLQLEHESFFGEDRQIADNLNHISSGLKNAVETATKSERMKAELITNVSHDIKTPLTSIINYVDLLKREKLDNEKANGYLEILDQKSQKLKTLTEDLVEASKASSGNLALEMNLLNLTEMLHQVNGEFSEKMEGAGLHLVEDFPKEPLHIMADGRYIWRILENLYQNAVKYAMPGTRVYAALAKEEEQIHFSLKNISAEPLNIPAEELTERFTRGDGSRNSEGSGLGLSIAKSLTELQHGTFALYLDGDLFRADVRFPASPLNLRH